MRSSDPEMTCITQHTYDWIWQVCLGIKCNNLVKICTWSQCLLIYIKNESIFINNIQTPSLEFATSLNLTILCPLLFLYQIRHLSRANDKALEKFYLWRTNKKLKIEETFSTMCFKIKFFEDWVWKVRRLSFLCRLQEIKITWTNPC